MRWFILILFLPTVLLGTNPGNCLNCDPAALRHAISTLDDSMGSADDSIWIVKGRVLDGETEDIKYLPIR